MRKTNREIVEDAINKLFKDDPFIFEKSGFVFKTGENRYTIIGGDADWWNQPYIGIVRPYPICKEEVCNRLIKSDKNSHI